MTRINELIIALAATIVSYCEIKTSNKPTLKTLREGERNGVVWDYPDFSTVSALINEATKKDTSRFSFLNYLKGEILILTEYTTLKEPLSDVEFTALSNKIQQMLISFKTLLATKQDRQTMVTPNSSLQKSTNPINLPGLLNTSAAGSTYCNSGNCLKKEVFDRFNLSLQEDNIQLRTFASSICTEYQNNLLVQSQNKTIGQLKNKIDKLKTKTTKQSEPSNSNTLTDTDATSQNSVNALKTPLPKTQEEISAQNKIDILMGSNIDLNEQLTNKNTIIDALTTRINHFEKEKVENEQTITVQQKTIAELSSEISKLKGENAVLNNEISLLRGTLKISNFSVTPTNLIGIRNVTPELSDEDIRFFKTTDTSKIKINNLNTNNLNTNNLDLFKIKPHTS